MQSSRIRGIKWISIRWAEVGELHSVEYSVKQVAPCGIAHVEYPWIFDVRLIERYEIAHINGFETC